MTNEANAMFPWPSTSFIGIGVGPGDPGYLGVKAVAFMQRADIAFAPVAKNGENSLAASIALSVGLDKDKLCFIEFPMEKDRSLLQAAWRKAAEPVKEVLDAGKRCVFLTLGDPSLYSTWTYLKRALLELRPQTVFTTVPGIMAANAAAAVLGRPLAEGSQRMALLPLPDPVSTLDQYRTLVDRLVLYKIGARLPELASWVRKNNLGRTADLVIAVGIPGREKYGPLLELAEQANGYLSLAIIDTVSCSDTAKTELL